MQETPKLWLLSAVVSVCLATADAAFAECDADIIGKWQQAYLEFAGNRINDDSQSWESLDHGGGITHVVRVK
jgi:hypothetical protein